MLMLMMVAMAVLMWLRIGESRRDYSSQRNGRGSVCRVSDPRFRFPFFGSLDRSRDGSRRWHIVCVVCL